MILNWPIKEEVQNPSALEKKHIDFESKVKAARVTVLRKIRQLNLGVDMDYLESLRIEMVPGRVSAFWYAEDKITIGKGLIAFYREGLALSTVAHEYTHACVYDLYWKKGKRAYTHGKEFYTLFVKICPPDIQHFELAYIRTSALYGIQPLPTRIE